MSNQKPSFMQFFQLENQGWRYLYNEQIELALDSFEKGLKLAEDSASYCQELNFRYHIVQVYMYYISDQKAALDLAVRLLTRSKRPEYENCYSYHVRIYDIVIHAYYYRDCLGYEKEIRESIAYVEDNFMVQTETRLRLDFIRAEMDYETGEYESGRNRVMQYIAKAEHAHPYRKSDGYVAGQRVMYALGELTMAYKYADLNAQYSQQGVYQRGVADARMWQAVYARRLGNDEEAQRLMQQGISIYEQHKMSLTQSYFDALAEYHELCGEDEKALELLQSQFDELPARGSLHDVALAHLQYCRFLGRHGKPIDEAAQKARDFFQTMPKSEAHEPTLQRIEAGDYYQFDWQAV